MVTLSITTSCPFLTPDLHTLFRSFVSHINLYARSNRMQQKSRNSVMYWRRYAVVTLEDTWETLQCTASYCTVSQRLTCVAVSYQNTPPTHCLAYISVSSYRFDLVPFASGRVHELLYDATKSKPIGYPQTVWLRRLHVQLIEFSGAEFACDSEIDMIVVFLRTVGMQCKRHGKIWSKTT